MTPETKTGVKRRKTRSRCGAKGERADGTSKQWGGIVGGSARGRGVSGRVDSGYNVGGNRRAQGTGLVCFGGNGLTTASATDSAAMAVAGQNLTKIHTKSLKKCKK